MTDHRVRLTDDELRLITSALRARVAMIRGQRRDTILRLTHRLEEMTPGNPDWLFSSFGEAASRERARAATIVGRASI